MAQPIIVGGTIECRCSRCKDITGHIIHVMNEEIPQKVECRACGSVHKYAKPRIKGATTAKTKRRSTRPGPTSSARRLLEMTLESLDESQAKPYAITAIFKDGDVVKHAKFGLGKVLELVPPNKVKILFEEGTKLMICGGHE
ncbi:MAG: hypothetical protein ACNI27_00765 [Desulfovibrio sp.]